MSVFHDRNGPLCIVQGCSNGFQSNSSIEYFPVPVNTIQHALTWYKNTMRTDLRPSAIHHVCEQHFEESCFEQNCNGRKTLRPKSMPTLFDLEVFYKMIAYQESNKTIKKTNITFHTSNPEIDGKTLEPILKLNSASEHIKTRLAPTANPEQENPQTSEHLETRASNRCHVDGCPHNYVARRHRVQLYKISRDPVVARQWLDACGFESMLVNNSTSTFKVCREHFTPQDFEGPATLRSDAVPTQFSERCRASMEKTRGPGSVNKRFRSDNNVKNFNNKRISLSDRSSMEIDLTETSPAGTDQFDDSISMKNNNDIELSMFCFEEQLSEAQLKHNTVKALDRTETNNNGPLVKPKNPVGRPRIHPRQPTANINNVRRYEEIDEFDRKRERPWQNNGHQDDRIISNKRIEIATPTTTNNRENRSIEPIQRSTMNFNKQMVNVRDSTVKGPMIRNQIVEERIDSELEQTYKRSLSKFYGQKSGKNCPLSDYVDYRSQCPICPDILFENNIQLIIHLNQHFKSSSTVESPFEQINTKCSYCQSEFSNPYFLAMHIDDKHWNEMNVFPCRICHENHSSVTQLIKHLSNVHGSLDTPYSCQVCSFRTSIYGDMIYHIDEIHKSTRYFFCQYCLITIELPLITINTMKVLNGTLAYEHLALHWNSIEQNRTNQCQKCLLHVSSIKDHLQNDHSTTNNNSVKHIYHHQKLNDGREFFDQSSMFNDRSINSRFVASTKHA